jgi:hypothetical protein
MSSIFTWVAADGVLQVAFQDNIVTQSRNTKRLGYSKTMAGVYCTARNFLDVIGFDPDLKISSTEIGAIQIRCPVCRHSAQGATFLAAGRITSDRQSRRFTNEPQSFYNDRLMSIMYM